MTELQALVAAYLCAALRSAPRQGLHVTAQLELDDDQSYRPSLVVTGQDGTRVRITVEETP